ncbi:MAG: acyl-CoA thioesterase [Burkholderiales bacterium]|nr:acyl-CoA thioesterase [Burkholderiales bacterium]
MKPFSLEHAIRFSHCDPGGIVYFPHFFEMIYVTVEDWFDRAIEPEFESRLRSRQIGFPTVNTQCAFYRPSRVGDRLSMHLSIARLGRSSVEFVLSGRSGDEERLRARHLIALVSLDTLRAIPIPEELRARMAPYVAGGADAPLARLPAPAPTRSATVFPTEYPIRFSHCDPGGIVHFPRFFDMINAAAEDWFGEALGIQFDAMHMGKRVGVPIVDTQCEFYKPCRIGERLVLELSVARLGRASFELTLSGKIDGEERIRARNVRAMMSLESYRAIPIPDDLRERMLPYVAAPAGA